MTPLKICLVSSEAAPFAKTGGLADVSAAIVRFLHGAGHDVKLVMPLYASIRSGATELRPHAALRNVPIRFGEQDFTFSVATSTLPESEAQVWFLDCPDLYGRDALYTADPDEHLRFALLARGAIEACQWAQWAPDCFHCNDWHTGLLPLYLRAGYDWDELFRGTKTLLTIHNIGYQGVFPAEALVELGLDEHSHLLFRADTDEGYVNFLKTGVLYADAVTTVSETYAREIQTAELGMGLEEVLRARRDSLFGIVNGVDYAEWSPESDRYLAHPFSAEDLGGKAANKRELLDDFGLDDGTDAPLLGIVSRLAVQKGFELLPEVLSVFLKQEDVRLVVLGSGEEKYETYFQLLRDSFPKKVAFYQGYSDELAHRIGAAADMFLMPSRYEPCGLNQMYSLRYGTIPIVRKTGGLADTVEQFDRASGEGTGFVFESFTPDALFQALRRALETYRDSDSWSRLMQNAMAQDFSWDQQGRHYVELYEKLKSG